MKRIACLIASAFAFAVAPALLAEPRTVTLTCAATEKPGSSPTPGTNELRIGPFETAQLVSYPVAFNSVGNSTQLQIEKDGLTLVYSPGYNPNIPSPGVGDPIIIAGPAIFQLRCYEPRGAICSFRISPESYPPDRAILVPPGTNQAQVTMECSTNLVEWFTATNGVYGPLPEAKFFRIKLEPAH